jgi:hypothetical protein
MTTAQRPTGVVESHTLIGTPAEIARIIATNQRSGRLVSASRIVPAPARDGRVIVQLRLRPAARPQLPARPATTPDPAARRRLLRVVGIGAALLAVTATVATLVALVVGAVNTAAHAVDHALASSADLLVGIGVIVLILAALLGAGATGHCPGCRR